MIIEECEQGSEEWKTLRLGVVTASGFSKVLTGGQGRTRLKYMQRLAHEIVTGQKIETYKSDAMIRGTNLEPQARNAYIRKTQRPVEQVGFIFKCEKRRVGGSPDGLIGRDGGIEIKCPLPQTHEKYKTTGKVPKAYIAQIQGNMWITGRQWWDFVSYVPGLDLIIQRIQRDNHYIDVLENKVHIFVNELDTMISEYTTRYARF